MKFIYTMLVICEFTLSAYTQTSIKDEKIRQMLDLTGSGKLGAQIAQNVISSFREKYTYVDQNFWNELEKEIKPGDLINSVIPIYAKYYTEEDINQIIAFYNSPTGKKMIESTPLILQESMTTGKNWSQQVSEKIIEQLKEKEYLEK
jgi:uncharacterized protein